ncbi:ATP-binding protein [uncultured Thiodictyon sp.]|uniref:ATP-binding protein n=1 Tax=uncultured Thiodictyon sp. TaxID=1846217 RepID=UPI0025FECDB5|nr:ATP-binding protein [uncultured Thiodictyon sp.]
MRQVLTNLLGNALAHTQAGEVRLSAATTPDPAAADRVELRLAVADTGPGIPAAEQARIFEAFVQGDADATAAPGPGPGGHGSVGSGLGLNISRKLVRRMGGRIELESAPGTGSRFTLVLPAVLIARAADCAGAAMADPECAETATPAPLAAPPPPEALAELRALAELGRTTRIEGWCRHWSGPGDRPAFTAQVLALAHAFEHARIIALVEAQAGGTGQDSGQ